MKSPITAADVHEQSGISFITPPFFDKYMEEIVMVRLFCTVNLFSFIKNIALRCLQTHIFLYKPSENIQSEPLEFFYHPTKPMSWRDKSTQTMESCIQIEPRTHLPTLNRRLKRPIFDDFPTRAKVPSLKPEPLDSSVKIETDTFEEDSGFCEPLAKSTLPMILLEARDRESRKINQ